MYLVDTNIFLELLLGRKKSNDCEEFLNLVADGRIDAVVTSFSIHAVEAIIGKNYRLLQDFLRNVINSIGLRVYMTTNEEELEAAIVAEKTKLDFDDGIQYFVAKKLGVRAIISFDEHFDGLDIPRKEPKEILNEMK
jgi:hypothetical protein